MISIENFVALIAPDVAGCPNKLITMVLQNVIFKFCTDAWVLQRGVGEIISSINTSMNNQSVVSLTSLSDESLIPVGVVSLEIDQVAYTVDRLQSLTHAVQLAEEQSKKYYYFDGEDNYNLVLYPMSVDNEVFLILAVAPKLGSEYVDSTLYDTWCDAIVSGVKSQLFRMPQKLWTDLTSALLMQKEYNRFVVDARRKVRKSFSTKSLAVGPRSDDIWF